MTANPNEVTDEDRAAGIQIREDPVPLKVRAPDDGVPPALAARLERIEASLTWLCGLAESAQEALAKLEGHPMLGKLFSRPDADVSNGHGG